MNLLVLLLLSAAPVGGQVREGTPDSVNLVKARANGNTQQFEWLPWAPASFARAKAENKFVLVDGAAEWCHWCHVMDETTYRDAEVGQWLSKNAIAIRVDIDERPDLAERYGEWGWPATILLSSDAHELGKFRGYLPTEKLLEILHGLDATSPMEAAAEPPGIPLAGVPAAMKQAIARLDFFWDEQEGGWGMRRKVPIGMNVLWELARGTKASVARADFTLGKQRALIDPVAGGIYQYSAAEDWNDPHFEKLISFQTPNLEASARGFLSTRKQPHLDDARAIYRYLTTTLRSPDGDFYVNQDADVNAHDRSKPFVDGHVYYALDAAGRAAVGAPWVDTHVYAADNGRAISALLAFFEASGEGLEEARKTADRLALTHVLADGSVKREATSSAKGPFFLDDAACLGLAYARLGKLTKDPKYAALSRLITARMLTSFSDARAPMFDATLDADAVGVFARRRHSFAPNVNAARLLAAAGERDRGRMLIAALSGKDRLDGEWSWVGDYLLAAKELGFEPAR